LVLLRILRPTSATLFPYTTLFRSRLYPRPRGRLPRAARRPDRSRHERGPLQLQPRSHAEHQGRYDRVRAAAKETGRAIGVLADLDRKSTRLNSSHVKISYAVFCLK